MLNICTFSLPSPPPSPDALIMLLGKKCALSSGRRGLLATIWLHSCVRGFQGISGGVFLWSICERKRGPGAEGLRRRWTPAIKPLYGLGEWRHSGVWFPDRSKRSVVLMQKLEIRILHLRFLVWEIHYALCIIANIKKTCFAFLLYYLICFATWVHRDVGSSNTYTKTWNTYRQGPYKHGIRTWVFCIIW